MHINPVLTLFRIGLLWYAGKNHFSHIHGAIVKLPVSELLLTEISRTDFHTKLPQHRRLYEALRGAILSHQLPFGGKLPSTRDLAQDLKLSRNTVLSAFEQLLAEGYVMAQTGSGTFVADTLPDQLAQPSADNVSSQNIALQTASATSRTLSLRGAAMSSVAGGRLFEIQPFAPGDADYSAFPFKLWQRLQNKYWRAGRPELLDYGQAGGYLPLRHAIADYLRVSRSVRVTVDQVLITAGTQQSLDLCAHLLADHHDTAWVEDPCYWGARRALEANGLKLHPVPVDNEGMNPGVEDLVKPPRLIYLTPSHQYPKSVVMSLARRRLLLELAARNNAWILEDDYDSEFRYAGRPLASLQGMDHHDRVLYLGTFAKVLYPGLKIGYIVVPPDLVDAFKTGLYDFQRPGQMMLQAALADFIELGYFATHLRKMRLIYGRRRLLLVKTLFGALGNQIKLSPAEAGMHLVIQLPDYADDVAMAAMAAEYDISVRALSTYYLSDRREKGLVVGYAYVPPEKIVFYGRLLANVVKAGLNK
jgi:GntR family transcriptional regulator / MocR family aminotransferase